MDLTPTRGTPEPGSALHERLSDPARPIRESPLPFGCRCGERWSGSRTCHCGACHVTYSGVSHFDRHRKGGLCFDPRDIGCTLLPNRSYPCWGEPDPTPEEA